MKEFIEFIAKQLVDKPDNVIVEETTPDENTIAVTLKVDNSDIGKVIGKHGQNVKAMRIYYMLLKEKNIIEQRYKS